MTLNELQQLDTEPESFYPEVFSFLSVLCP